MKKHHLAIITPFIEKIHIRNIFPFIILFVVSTGFVSAATVTISTATTSQHTVDNGDGLEVTENGSIIITGTEAVTASGVTISFITNSGTITSTTDDAIELDDVVVSGSITNNGIINSAGSDNDNGIEVDDGYVHGSIINNGTIISTGDNGIAVWGDDDNDKTDNKGVVLGGIINNGTISSYEEGMDLDDDARIEGGIINTGVIESSNYVAIEIDQDTIVNGGLINSGTIESLITDAIEIDGDSVLNGGLENKAGGIIRAAVDTIWIDDASALNGGITNRGTMLAGDDLLVLDDDASTLTGGIHNYGTMIAVDDIVVIESGSTFTGGITNYEGGIIAGELSFDAASGTTFTNSGVLVLKDTSVIRGQERITGDIVDNDMIGTYTQTSTGLLNLGIDDAATGAGTGYSNLAVTGNVNLPAQAKIELDVKNNGANISIDDRFEDVISATGTLSTSTFSISDNLLSLNFSAVNDGEGNVDIIATETGMTTIVQATIDTNQTSDSGSAANTSDEAKIPYSGSAAVFDAILAGGASTPDMDAVLVQITSLGSAQEVSNAVESTLPSISGGVAQMTNIATSAITGVVASRQDLSRGLSSGDEMMVNRNFWLKPFGNWVEQDDRQGVTGYDIENWGIAAGADADISSTWNLGVAFSYIDSEVESNLAAGNHNVAVDSYLGKVYATAMLDSKTALNIQAGLGMANYDSHRSIFNGSVANADYNSLLVQASAELERSYKVTKDFLLTPYVKVDYSYVDVESYQETGAGALNLNVNDDSNNILTIGAGSKAQYNATEKLILSVDAGAGYDVFAEKSQLTSSFAGGGASFTTAGMKPDEVVYNAGFGAKYSVNKESEITARYAFNGREDYTYQSVSVNVSVLF